MHCLKMQVKCLNLAAKFSIARRHSIGLLAKRTLFYGISTLNQYKLHLEDVSITSFTVYTFLGMLRLPD